LSADIFGVNSQPGLSAAENHVPVPLHGGDFGNVWHAEAKVPGVGATIFMAWRRSSDLPRVALTVCVRPSRHTVIWMPAACRNLMDHAAKLRRAFDALPVDFRHDVIFLEARLGAGLSGTIFPRTTPRSADSFSSLALRRSLVGFDAEPTRAVRRRSRYSDHPSRCR